MFEFKADDVNPIDINWKSPLQLKINDICEEAGRAAAKAFDDMVFRAVEEVGVKVDRDELIKALAYDREQYRKGYGDGYRAAQDDLVRCRDCEYWRHDFEDVGICVVDAPDIDGVERLADDFCSYAERGGF
jgi:hypothetical protein